MRSQFELFKSHIIKAWGYFLERPNANLDLLGEEIDTFGRTCERVIKEWL